MFIGGAFSGRPDEPFRADADALAGADRRGARARLPGLGRQPARRASRAGRRCSTGSGGRSRTQPGDLRARGRSAAGRAVRLTRREGARTSASRRPRSWRPAAPSRPGLARPHRARRRRSRRHLAPPAIEARGRDGRPRALPQAVAMARLFADRAAGGGRASRSTDLDGLTGLPEYRNGGLFLDTGVLALKRPGARRRAARGRLGARRRMARADRRAARPDRRRGPRKLGLSAERVPARQGAGGRHLGDRPPARRDAAPRRRAAAPGHQRRHGVLTAGLTGRPASRVRCGRSGAAACRASPSSITRWCSTS